MPDTQHQDEGLDLRKFFIEPGPDIGEAEDHVPALLCRETRRGVQAVRLLHSGGALDTDILHHNYSHPERVKQLMRCGPIYHLGPMHRGFRWSGPRSDDNYDYLISLSRGRRHHPRELLTFPGLPAMCHGAQELGIDHAYVWRREPEDAPDTGTWCYVRAVARPAVRLPADPDIQRAVGMIERLVEAGNRGDDYDPEDNDDDEAWDDEDTVQYAELPPPRGFARALVFGAWGEGDLRLMVDHRGIIHAAAPLDTAPGSRRDDPENFGIIPLSDHERSVLARRLANTYS